MRLPYAMLSADGRPAVRCYPGSFVGRMPSARLSIPDVRVPEAAALVSARADGLYLLALRRPVKVRGQEAMNVPLARGTRIALAPGVEVRCEEVWAPEVALGVRLDGGDPRPLGWDAYALRPEAPDWLTRLAPGEAAPGPVIWCSEGEFFLQIGADAAHLVPGTTHAVGGHALEVVEVRAVPSAATAQPEPPEHVSIEVSPAEVTLVVADARHALPGQSADLLRLLCLHGGRAHWRDAVAGLWGRVPEADLEAKRESLYRNVLWRLDRHLRARGVSDGLVLREGGWLALGEHTTWSAR